MAIAIELAPEETLGRKFQYAFLSYALRFGGVSWDPLSGVMEFATPQVFVKVVQAVRDSILATFLRTGQRGACKNVGIIKNIDCCVLDRGPKVYSVTVKDQRGRSVKLSEGELWAKILALTDLGAPCAIRVVKKRKGKEREVIVSEWLHAALSYAHLIFENKKILEAKSKEFEPPVLARATLFGKVRKTYTTTQSKVKININTLGTILLGGALAYLGRFKLGQEDTEFYLIPDSPNKEYATLRDVVAVGDASIGSNSNIAGISAWIASNFTVSLEVAFSLALVAKLSGASITASQLESGGVVFAAKIYSIRPQQWRPMIIESIPLSLNIAKAYEPETISSLISFAKNSLRDRDALQKGAPNAISRCFSSMFLQSLDPCWTSHLTECIRELDTLSIALKGSLAHMSRLLKVRLSREYEDLVTREC